ncbi:hypothetical protein EMIHUDRAFT_356644, partial [Emiliania huxleyi CCMP1516]|uniref:Ferredoxin thioredoxin reductase alpha chain domain-containing protein n=2 Tax=Emiliania huxleyi TaxID=2903 RepID=A0A0D3IT08_EMIH1
MSRAIYLALLCLASSASALLSPLLAPPPPPLSAQHLPRSGQHVGVRGTAGRAAHAPRRCSTVSAKLGLAGLKLDQPQTIAVGARVRVSKRVVLRHVPKHKEGLDVQGLEGEVIKSYGRGDISANRPIKVEFQSPRFVGHFDVNELSLVDQPEAT